MNRLKTKGAVVRAAGAMSGTSLDGVDIAVKVVSPHMFDPKGGRMHG